MTNNRAVAAEELVPPPRSGRHRAPRKRLRARHPAVIAGATVVAVTAVGGLQATRSWGAQAGVSADLVATVLPAASSDRLDDLVRERALRTTRLGTERVAAAAAATHKAALTKKRAAAREATAAAAAADAREIARAYRETYAETYADTYAQAFAAASRAVALRTAAAAAGTWALPVQGATVTARFGQVGHMWTTVHTGVDLACPEGTTVRAAGAGTVVSAGDDGVYGLRIRILHPDGTETRYGHLSAFVVRGGQVQAGQVIGLSGNTGNSSGPHLHFEVRTHGIPIDPQVWLAARGLAV